MISFILSTNMAAVLLSINVLFTLVCEYDLWENSLRPELLAWCDYLLYLEINIHYAVLEFVNIWVGHRP